MPSKLTSTSARSSMGATIGWVRGKLILSVRPRLLDRGERGPCVGELRRLGGGERRHEFGEGLVEPQIVPPPHGHEVRRTTCGRAHGGWSPCVARPLPRWDASGRRSSPGTSRRPAFSIAPGIELRHEELVVLLERVRRSRTARSKNSKPARVSAEEFRPSRGARAAKPGSTDAQGTIEAVRGLVSFECTDASRGRR